MNCLGQAYTVMFCILYCITQKLNFADFELATLQLAEVRLANIELAHNSHPRFYPMIVMKAYQLDQCGCVGRDQQLVVCRASRARDPSGGT